MGVDEGSGSGVIWWVCFLPAQDPIYHHISEVGAALKKSGQHLIVFSPPGDYAAHAGFTHFPIPFSLTEHGRQWSKLLTSHPLPLSASALPDFLDAERLWCGIGPSADTELMLLRAFAFWEKAIEILQPSVILAWGTTAPFSRLLLRLGALTHTPSYVMERGLTESTVMMNLVGQCRLSNIGMRTRFIDPVYPDDLVDGEWQAIKNYYRWPTVDGLEHHASTQGVADGRPKTVLYLGAHDVGSGMAFDNPRVGDRFGTWIHRSQEGAEALAASLSHVAPGSRLVVKAHPADRPIDFSAFTDIDVELRPDADFRDLILDCDVCVTPISTTQIFGFLLDRPVVTLANSFFTGRDLAYEAFDAGSLAVALRAALDRQDWEERRQQAKRLITALFREEFIGLSKDVPTALKAQDLVTHLARFRHYQRADARPVEERLEAFEAFAAASRGEPASWTASHLAIVTGQDVWRSIEQDIQGRLLSEVADSIEQDRFADGDAAAFGKVGEAVRRALHRASSEAHAAWAPRLADHEQQIAVLNNANADLQTVVTRQAAETVEAQERADRLGGEVHRLSQEVETLRQSLEQVDQQAQSQRWQAEASLAAVNRQTVDLTRKLHVSEAEQAALRRELELLMTWGAEHARRYGASRATLLGGLLKDRKGGEAAPYLNSVAYLLANQDVAKAGLDPIEHYHRFGRREGRRTAIPKAP